MGEKDDNIKLLNTRIGTPMYYLTFSPNGKDLTIDEVTYRGYELETRTASYEEPGRVRYCEWEQPVFAIHFTTRKGKNITIRVDDNHWTGQRGFDTDEHLEYGMVDCYFTTSKEKLKAFIEQQGFLDKILEEKKKLDRAHNALMKIYE